MCHSNTQQQYSLEKWGDASRSAFSLLELLIVAAIISVLFALLLPSMAMVRASARSVACMGSLRQIGQGALLYASEHYERLPYTEAGDGADVWQQKMAEYVGLSSSSSGAIIATSPPFVCAETAARSDYLKVGVPMSEERPVYYDTAVRKKRAEWITYFFNYEIRNDYWSGYRTRVPNPAEILFVADGVPWNTAALCVPTTSPLPTGLSWVDTRHKGGANYVFVDGHVEHRKGMPTETTTPNIFSWR